MKLEAEVAPFQGDRKRPHGDALRMAAGFLYVSDPDGISVADLRTDPRFKHVPETTLQNWATADGWTQWREDLHKKARAKAESQLTSMLAQAQIGQLRTNFQVRDVLLAHIFGERDADGKWLIYPTAPKSLEGLVKVYLELSDKQLELARSLGSEIVPGGAGGSAGGRNGAMLPVTGRTRDEVRALARQVTQQRRVERQGGAASAEESDAARQPIPAVADPGQEGAV